MVIVGDAIDSFGDSLAVGVVGVGNTCSIFFHAHELPPVLPCISPCTVCEGVANGVVGDGVPPASSAFSKLKAELAAHSSPQVLKN